MQLMQPLHKILLHELHWSISGLCGADLVKSWFQGLMSLLWKSEIRQKSWKWMWTRNQILQWASESWAFPQWWYSKTVRAYELR
ncbi:MAG: hypothetical protein ACD_3C00028G0001 [uncultured bacterium (gcode 4)]|uniref:Uncharacterized protein n=1 Tax=uncultured bacterium (gcode 4) TaxID=1234023 RepID=K2G337_9BACT|nr:MAG: hypothetical protein ACD_3C00028G0001 [uncultured bacterium (gcode 4)]